MKKILISMILISMMTIAVEAQEEKKRIAVLPFEYGGGLTEDEAAWLTDSIRTALIGTDKYEVISNDQIENMMKLEAKKQGVGSGSCSSEQCIIDLGNALECEKVLTGKASGAFGVFSITGKILDVVAQKYEKAQEVTIKNKNDFPQAAQDMVRKLTGFGDFSAPSRDTRNTKRQRTKEREGYPTRDKNDFGFGIWLMGMGGTLGYAVDYFITPTFSLEGGGGLGFKTIYSYSSYSDYELESVGTYFFGMKYSLFGNSKTARWSPYIGSFMMISLWDYKPYDYYTYDYVTESTGAIYEWVIPVGFEFVALNGFSLTLEAEYYVPIGDKSIYTGSGDVLIDKETYWFGVKLGWHI
ncbi:MAG: hypothetical protein OEZ13_02410 [Spirochaetia bacterium]|nr:hypothetical protein [Spirochaetia bacterium]